MPVVGQKGWFKAARGPVPAVICASKRFGAFSPETERAVRLPQVAVDEKIEKLAGLFHDISKGIAPVRNPYMLIPDRAYEAFCKGLGKERFSAADIERFSVAMPSVLETDYSEHAGPFLSALIKKSEDSDFRIYTSHLPYALRQLGFRNSKPVEIMGSAGDYCGEYMSGGSITVRGNAGFRIGTEMTYGMILIMGNAGDETGTVMKGGTISVKGTAGDLIGFHMKGGIIRISGDAGHHVACCMGGGDIHLDGDFISIESVEHGRIFHRTRLVVYK